MEELPLYSNQDLLSATLYQDNFITKLIFLIIMVLVSALLSGSEVAFFSLTKNDLDDLKAEESPSGKVINKLLQAPKRLLATILVGNNAINIGLVLLFDSANFFSGFDDIIWLGFISSKFVLEVGVVALIILLFGEIFPKIYANSNKVIFSRFTCWTVYVLDIILRPLTVPMQKSSDYLQSYLGKQKSNLSVGQLSHALELTYKEDTSHMEEKMLKGIISFGNTETKQIMNSRVDIIALNEQMKFSEVIELVIKSSFSRIPVYKENMDDISGILYSKDLLEHIEKKDFNWTKLKRDVYFVPENKKLDDLLKEFQQKKIHLAIVVDEYGGTSGLVTLEDIIEEIVGEISDEFDQEDLLHRRVDENNFIFEGKMMLKDFYRILKLEEDQENIFEDKKGESETLAGFILEVAGVFPKKGDKIIYENYTFEVLMIDKKRIKQIKVTLSK